MKVFLLFLISLAATNLAAQTSYVPATQVLKRKGYQLSFGGDSFTTTKNVDAEGTATSPAEGENFSRTQGEFGGLYGATDNLQFGLGARFRQNKSTFIYNSEEIHGSSSGIESAFGTLHYAFKPVGQLQYTLEGLYRMRPFKNEVLDAENIEDLIIGDDGSEYSLGLGATYAFKSKNYLTLRGGYRVPGSDLSDELYWQAEGALVWKYVALIAGVDGVSSLSNDPYEDEPTQRPVLNTGRTNLYNSSNREWVAPYAGVNFALGKNWRVEFKGSQVVSGTSTDLGTSYGVQLIRRIDKVAANHPDKKFKSYDIEVTVVKISPKKNYVSIDRGLAEDVQKGMVFDFFEFDYLGGNVLVARGVVVQSKADSAIVKITNRYNTEKEIKTGLIGRASIR